MKLSTACVACLLLILCHAVLGQDIRKVQEPEYLGVFFSLDASTGNLIPLERLTPEYKIKTKAMGLGGGKSLLEFRGERSPIRFKEGQTLEFVVLVSSQQTDPQGSLQFFSLESLKGKRQLILAKAKLTSTTDKSVVRESAVSFNAAKYGTSSFKITSAQNLPPGEYLLSTTGTNDGFCFGVDPINAKP